MSDHPEKLPDGKNISVSSDLGEIANALEFLKGVQADLRAVGAETAVLHDAETPGASLSPGSSPSAVGQPNRIGRFEVQTLLGRGGFANVYLARDPSLDRLVAVKVLKQTFQPSDETTARFEREAKAVATLDHPNIVTVFETGVENGHRYIASAYCRGFNLKEWIDQQDGPVDPRVAAETLAAIAEAIHHAHQRGVVHRDLKPANILIEAEAGEPTRELESGKLHIADFGLARLDESLDQLETTEGAIVGTPAYMSPEQATASKEINASTDVYSLGVMLYELLTGRFPILRDTHIETLLAINTEEPQPPSRLNPATPRDLEAICLKCLEKKPADRYSSAFDLAADLRRWLDGRAVTARRITVVERLGKWCRRNPALTTALVGLVAGLAFAMVQWRTAINENQRADRHLMMTQDVIGEMVSQVAADTSLPPELRLSLATRAVDLQDVLLKEQPDDIRIISQTSIAYVRMARVQADLLNYEGALESIEEAGAILQPVSGDPAIVDLEIEVADRRIGILRLLNRNDEARESLAELENGPALNEAQRATQLFQSGMLKLNQRTDLEGAVDDFLESIAIYEVLEVDGNYGYQIGLSSLFGGTAELYRENLSAARMHLTRAVERLDGLENNMHESSDVTENLARSHLQLARVVLGELRLEGLPVDSQSQLLVECRENFDSAAEGFRNAIEMNATKHGAYGQLAMVFELRIRLETEQQSDDCGTAIALQYDDLFTNLPVDNPVRRPMGRILGESRVRIAQALIARGDIEDALDQLNACDELVTALIEEFPGVEKLEAVRESCEELLEQYSD